MARNLMRIGLRRFATQSRGVDYGLYLVTDDVYADATLPERVEAAIQGGTTIVQLRLKHVSTLEYIQWAECIQPICRRCALLRFPFPQPVLWPSPVAEFPRFLFLPPPPPQPAQTSPCLSTTTQCYRHFQDRHLCGAERQVTRK